MHVWTGLMVLAGGLFAGGAATFAWSRVPIWRRMEVPALVDDFAQTLHRTDKVQPGLLVTAAVAAVGVAVGGEGAAGLLAALNAAGFLLVLAGSVTFLVPLQRRIIASPVGDVGTIEELRRRWFRANLGRSVLAALSFAVMAVAATV